MSVPNLHSLFILSTTLRADLFGRWNSQMLESLFEVVQQTGRVTPMQNKPKDHSPQPSQCSLLLGCERLIRHVQPAQERLDPDSSSDVNRWLHLSEIPLQHFTFIGWATFQNQKPEASEENWGVSSIARRHVNWHRIIGKQLPSWSKPPPSKNE